MSLKVILCTWSRLLHPNVYFSGDTGWPTFAYQGKYKLFLSKCPETIPNELAELFEVIFWVQPDRELSSTPCTPFSSSLWVPGCSSELKQSLPKKVTAGFDFVRKEDVIRLWMSSRAHKGELLVLLHGRSAGKSSWRNFVGPALRMNSASTTGCEKAPWSWIQVFSISKRENCGFAKEN